MARVLIVEDEAGVRKLSKRLIEMLGYTVDDVSSGEKAIMKIRRRRYDVVLTDLGLPGMDGWNVAQMVKRLSPKTAVGLVSGWNVLPSSSKLEEYGVDFVLSKPFDLDKAEQYLEKYS